MKLKNQKPVLTTTERLVICSTKYHKEKKKKKTMELDKFFVKYFITRFLLFSCVAYHNVI